MEKQILKRRCRLLIPVLAFALVFAGCGNNREENKTEEIPPFDPSQPIVISDFTPKTGGVGQRLILYGQNFGNDPEMVHLYIGGKEAKVIGVKGEVLYCVVPGKAFAGNIEMRIGEGEDAATATVEEVFEYQKRMVTSTLFGYRNERDDQPEGNWGLLAGYDDAVDYKKSTPLTRQATCQKQASWLEFDPLDSRILYMAYDGGAFARVLLDDSVSQRVLTKAQAGNGNMRLRSIAFTRDGQQMIIANDQGGVNDRSTIILERRNNFKSPTILTTYKGCNGAAIHPGSGESGEIGEMYFNSYEKGQFYRLDLRESTYFGGTKGTKDYDELFKIQDASWEFNIRIHPTGNYAYIVVMNKHYILRCDYNWKARRFNQPYVICGEASPDGGYVDGVGTSARLGRPYQGVFVKNPDYAGSDDEYDFYFTESNNHCIRILSPDGAVTTFAGRGSPGLNASFSGYVEGDLRLEARFNQPTGLAYDEATNTFYIGDRGNRRIRKIAMETEEDETGGETGEETGGEENEENNE
jgi:hypothetical protein